MSQKPTAHFTTTVGFFQGVLSFILTILLEILSSLSFSPSEGSLIYVAEINPETIEQKGAPLAKFQFTPSVGEGYPGKKRPGIFWVTWNSADIAAQPRVRLLQPLEHPSQPVIFTQPVFATDSRIFAVGYEYTQDYRLLGVKFCTNRLASLWEFVIPDGDAEGEVLPCTAIRRTQPSLSVRCPRVHFVNGEAFSLVWLSNPIGGPHASCSILHSHDLKSNSWSEKVLVESISDPQPGDFPGIFTTTLPTEPFIVRDNDVFLITGSIWRSRAVILSISLQTGKVVNLTPSEDLLCYSWSVLGTDDHDQLIAVRSSPTTPPELFVGRLLVASDVQWRQLSKPRLSDSSSYLDLSISLA